MLLDPRALVLVGCNALLLFLSLLVNSALSATPFYLFLLGPMLVLPVLYLRHRSYFLCTVLTGLWVDAAFPIPFGFFTIAFLFAGALLFMVRIRFRTEHNYHAVLIAHGLNLYLLAVLTIGLGRDYFAASEFWIQVCMTLFSSHLALLIVAPWFFNLERLLFEICRLETEPEDFPVI
jgi:hypothetical protein